MTGTPNKSGWQLIAAAAVVIGLTAATSASIYNVVQRGGVYFNATTSQKTDAVGNAMVSDGDRDRDFGAIISSGLGTINTLAPGTAVVCPTAVNISKYSRVTLLLTWNFAAAADSDSVNVCINLYGKTSANMSDGINNQLFIRLPSQATSATTTTDTAKVWIPAAVVASPTPYMPPTLYITRNTAVGTTYAGTTARSFGTSWFAAMQPRWFWTGVGSCAISLDNIPGIGAYPYLGVSIANANSAKSLTSVTASYWVSR